jgi:hypothetical protein
VRNLSKNGVLIGGYTPPYPPLYQNLEFSDEFPRGRAKSKKRSSMSVEFRKLEGEILQISEWNSIKTCKKYRNLSKRLTCSSMVRAKT